MAPPVPKTVPYIDHTPVSTPVLSQDALVAHLRSYQPPQSQRLYGLPADQLESSEEEDGENSEIISEHLQQLSSRVELGFPARFYLGGNAESSGEGQQLDCQDSTTHPSNETAHQASSEQRTSWSALTHQQIAVADEHSQSTYLERLPVAGTVRQSQRGSAAGDLGIIADLRSMDEVLSARKMTPSLAPMGRTDHRTTDLSTPPVMAESPPPFAEKRLSPPHTLAAQSMAAQSMAAQTLAAQTLAAQTLATQTLAAQTLAAQTSAATPAVSLPPSQVVDTGGGATLAPAMSPAEVQSFIHLLPSASLAARARNDPETVHAVRLLASALNLRSKFQMKYHVYDSKVVHPRPLLTDDHWGSTEPIFRPQDCPILPNVNGYVEMVNGICVIHTTLDPCPSSPAANHTTTTKDPNIPILANSSVPTVREYLTALKELMAVAQHPAVKSLAYQRLRYLEQRFSLHLLFNGNQEIADVRNNNHRDFYNVRKVDTHVHHSACMTQKHLLRFIRRKYRLEGDTVVARGAHGDLVTLAEIFQHDLGLTAWETSIDHLNVHALNSCFHRFDLFNAKYNPFGAALLREVFLKTSNLINGRYLAELTKEVMEDLEEKKYQHVEWRISIYGHSKDEWKKLALWMKTHKLYSKNVRWVIQVPRLYHIYRRRGVISSMKDFLSNVFEPLVEAILRPQDNPEIFEMVHSTVAWDSVDDESIVSKFTMAGGDMPLPEDWTSEDNPPYAYSMYYMYANIRAVNQLLQARGMNALHFRPHCGEAGSVSHLATAALLADGINHGIMLRKTPVLEYLYYLWQIGIAMSPLSNNALFHEISSSPVNSFFKIGLNVSLSSDDPLMFHFTDEALLEEYSVCAHLWKFTPVDLCELARNSVLQSNFETQYKRHWLGPKYYKKGPKGNRIECTNVPDIRLAYREETLKEELKFLRDLLISFEDEKEGSLLLGGSRLTSTVNGLQSHELC